MIGSKIKHQRKLLNLSLQSLADIVGKSKAHIYEIEEGKSDPSISTIRNISKALDVPILYLIDDNYNIGTYPDNIAIKKFNKINRIEIIDKNGRFYISYNVDLEFSIQDDGKTLKIFVNDKQKDD